ncbi:MAG: zinc-dependent peptidase [Betaproteobacteria bacterium]|nr:zinc-dependent peptidase [Betaproteobacteria bacterium]
MIRSIRDWLRDRSVSQRPDVTPAQWAAVEKRLPFLASLSPDDRRRLRQLAMGLLASKEISGAGGFEPDNHARLSIALQACLPILNLGLEWYDGWVGIVVYPGDFIIPRQFMDEAGVVHEFDDEVSGEAWLGGPVLVSWSEDTGDDDGMNVVIHEFAHKLDMLNGDADGLPPLHDGMIRREWQQALGRAFDDFCARADAGVDTAIDPYGAQSPAEFFAVATETFFEAPGLLLEDYPEVYEQLRRFYRQDPAHTATTG